MKTPISSYKIPTTILAIESSADETACAIVQKKQTDEIVTVLAETTATSLLKHGATKGIVPEVAAREQVKLIMPVIEETFAKATELQSSTVAKLINQIDAVAVTTQPGLIGSLLVGVETARTLAAVWNLPIIPVNHVSAHPYANFVQEVTKLKNLQSAISNSENWRLKIGNSNQQTSQLANQLTDNRPARSAFSTADAGGPTDQPSYRQPTFPLLSWVISGGHTQLTYYNSHTNMKVLGKTIDDAVGECLDKCARLLGGDYPGGPFIEELATEWQSSKATKLPNIKLPRPLIYEDTFNVSFSGLKTAFVRKYEELASSDQFYPSNFSGIKPDKVSRVNNETIQQFLAHELQHAISDVLLKKTAKALEQYPDTKSLLISGGVSANKFLQSKFKELAETRNLQFFCPSLQLSTDNAVMIGTYALFHPELQTHWQQVQAQPF